MQKRKQKSKKQTELTRNVFQDGPHLTCFAVCEKVLQEVDGVKSAIRMINRFTQTATGTNVPSTMQKVVRQMALLMSLKKGKGGKEQHRYEIRS